MDFYLHLPPELTLIELPLGASIHIGDLVVTPLGAFPVQSRTYFVNRHYNPTLARAQHYLIFRAAASAGTPHA